MVHGRLTWTQFRWYGGAPRFAIDFGGLQTWGSFGSCRMADYREVVVTN